jgi:hypothetical protein
LACLLPNHILPHFCLSGFLLDQRLKLINNHKRLPDSIHNFINYIYSDGEMLRRKNGHNPGTDWTLIISLTDLAYLLRMKDKIKHGERGRVLKEIEKISALVESMGLVKSYNLSDEDALVFELNVQETFPTADEDANLGDHDKPILLDTSRACDHPFSQSCPPLSQAKTVRLFRGRADFVLHAQEVGQVGQ